METLTQEFQSIKEQLKSVWAAAKYGEIAKLLMPEGREFVRRLNIPKGSKVLDVACGTGNLSLPAAKGGAIVTGIDIVPRLISEANENAAAEKLNIRFDVGDAEDLPYKDNEFDYVISMFGAMFAPRPEVTAKELVRVCKRGGTIAMANWTPEGFVGDFFRLIASYRPAPEGVPPPALWGNEQIVKDRFGKSVSDINVKRTICKLILNMPPKEAAEHYIKNFGPAHVTYHSLDERNKILFKNDLIKLWAEHNIAGKGETIVDAEYLAVIIKN